MSIFQANKLNRIKSGEIIIFASQSLNIKSLSVHFTFKLFLIFFNIASNIIKQSTIICLEVHYTWSHKLVDNQLEPQKNKKNGDGK